MPWFSFSTDSLSMFFRILPAPAEVVIQAVEDVGSVCGMHIEDCRVPVFGFLDSSLCFCSWVSVASVLIT